MHITHLLKRNIFTGLWHRTLPTQHGTSVQTQSLPSCSQTNSQQTRPPLQPLQKMNHNAGVTPTRKDAN